MNNGLYYELVDQITYLSCTSTRRFRKILVQQTPEFLYLQVRDKGLHHKPTCLQRCLPVSLISFPVLSTSVSHYHGIQSLVSRLQYVYKNIQLFFFFKGANAPSCRIEVYIIYFDKQNGSRSRIPSIALAIPKSVSFITGGRSPDGLSAKSKFSGFRS